MGDPERLPTAWPARRIVRWGSVGAVGLMLLLVGLAVPWPSPTPSLPALVVRTGTASVAYNWTSISNHSCLYEFPSSGSESSFSVEGATTPSVLHLAVADPWIEVEPPGFGEMFGGVTINISGDVAPDLHPSLVRVAVIEWANSSLRPLLGSPYSEYSATNVSNPSDIVFGPYSGTFEASLVGEPTAPSSLPSYHFELSQVLMLQSGATPPSGEFTLTFYALLVGLSAPVYAAETVTFAHQEVA